MKNKTLPQTIHFKFYESKISECYCRRKHF